METKQAALQKMISGDFSGARELAVAAQLLYHGTEGLDQMIAVCNVHCAGKDDWYGILGVAADSDMAAVRRQYGRMAVALHPDKNGLPGAREALELIVEAKAVLGDVEKWMAYDSMCRAGAIANQCCFDFSKFQDNRESCGFSRFKGVGLEDDGEVEILDFGVSRVLNYQKVELGGNGLFGSRWTNGENGVSTVQGRGRGRGCGRRRVNKENNDVTSIVGENGVSNQGQSHGQGCGRGRGRGRLNKEIDDVTNNVLDEKSGVVGVKRGRGRPRGSGTKAASGDAATKRPRGSGLNDTATKRPRGRPPGSGRGRGRGKSNNVEVIEVSSQDEGEKNKESQSQTASEDIKTKKFPSRIRPDSEMLEYTDAEFHDFEGERSRECLEAGQVWAVYDTLDAMPRFYAKINAILDDQRLEITWLEPLPEDEDEKRWLFRGLPASTGRFKQGYSEVIQDYGVFSHLVKWKRDAILKKVFAIRPQKGETWAVFKKWEGIGSSEGMKFGEVVEYEVVEIMSDYDGEKGVNVGVLDRVEGFGSVFGSREGKGEVIRAKDRLRLSHKIPSMSVIVGEMSFFELDPGSLPIMA